MAQKGITYPEHKASFLHAPGNILALMAYLIPAVLNLIGNNVPVLSWLTYTAWLVPALLLMVERSSKLVRFHAMQSLWLSLLILLLSFGTTILFLNMTVVEDGVATISAMGAVLVIVGLVIEVVLVVMEIWAALQAYQWISFRIPVLGKLASGIVQEKDPKSL